MAKPARIKPKANATPTAQVKQFHLWLMDAFDCVCGCGQQATVVHHPLTRHPLQRWRRDHEYVVPMDAHCHFALHANGNERKFLPGHDLAGSAWGYRAKGIDAGYLS